MRKFLIIFAIASLNIFPQKPVINKIEPPNWWTGMKLNKIQLMVYGKNLSGFSVSSNSKDIAIDSIHLMDNKNYSFIDIAISPSAPAGNYKLIFMKEKESVSVDFPLYDKSMSKNIHQGFGLEDVVYLIMPDRFADGDQSNNEIPGMINDYKPDDHLGRHGGDLQGIINHLDYFKELGVTALWLTPVLENNKPISYHGYAATDLYLVDRRFGSNAKYKELVEKAHEKGIKVIYDHVSNHIGAQHYWLSDMPMESWLNGSKEKHINTWHDKMVDFDIHGASITKEYLKKGWFVDDMADLNQQNRFVKKYLIQNTIWWVEYTGLDGIREDTYPYADQQFLSEWARTVMNEYPGFNIVGEVWTGVAPFLAAFQKDSKLNKNINTNLPVVTDFAIQNAYAAFLEGKEGLYKIYETVTQDFLYENPDNLLTFADNHDLPRIMLISNENIARVKLVLLHLFTSRGTPEILYATELGMIGNYEHGYLRSNFPGGFKDGSRNAFTSEGRTEKENELFNYTKQLLELRRKNLPLFKGTLKHLPPINNVYIYLKQYDGEKLLVVMNGDENRKEIDLSFIESLCGSKVNLVNIMTNTSAEIVNSKLVVQPYAGNIFKISN